MTESNQHHFDNDDKTPRCPLRPAPFGFFAKDWKIFMDTCSILPDWSERFFKQNAELLKLNPVVFPFRCYEELLNLSKNPKKDPDLRRRAKAALERVIRLRDAKLLQIFGEKTDNTHGDNVFRVVFTQYKVKYRLLLITQDRRLAGDIMRLNEAESEDSGRTFYCDVLRMRIDGTLDRIMKANEPYQSGLWLVPPILADRLADALAHRRPQNRPQKRPATTNELTPPPSHIRTADTAQTSRSVPQHRYEHQEHPVRSAPQPRIRENSRNTNSPAAGPRRNEHPEIFVFPLSRTVTPMPDDVLPLHIMPQAGDLVRDGNGGSWRLITELGSGGEGKVYDTGTDLVAKIYHPHANTRRKAEKIRLLTAHPIQCPGICAPQEMLFNGLGEFVGYLMPKAKGHDLLRCLMVRPLLEKRFAGWKKADLVQLCITILEKIRYLHARNIILGDINLSNVKVMGSRDVYFVDCDSWQVADYPCPVGQINFTPPELQGQSFRTLMRTKENEYFAVATMLFMILIPGKTPYAHQEGSDGAANISAGLFPYPYENKSTGKVPPGLWGFIWSHLTYDMKKAFGNTFDREGACHAPEKRLTTDQWIAELRQYLKLLTNGTLERQDAMSLEIFPTRYKRNPESATHVCRLCGAEFDEKSGRNGICNTCLFFKGDIYPCQKCGKDVVFSNFNRYVLNKKPFRFCEECFRAEQAVEYEFNCSSCGAHVTMSRSECDFYRSKGWGMPRRCKACRDANKRSEPAGVMVSDLNPPAHSPQGWGNSDSRTTAGGSNVYGYQSQQSSPPLPTGAYRRQAPQPKDDDSVVSKLAKLFGFR